MKATVLSMGHGYGHLTVWCGAWKPAHGPLTRSQAMAVESYAAAGCRCCSSPKAKRAPKSGPMHGPRFAIPSYGVSVRGSSAYSAMGTLESAKAQAQCYLGSRPGAVCDIEYSELCGNCRGSGRTPGRRRMSWKPCRVCKGKALLVADMRLLTFCGQDWNPCDQ